MPLARLLKRLAEVSAVLAFIAVLMAGGAALYAWLGPENGPKAAPEPQLTKEQVRRVLDWHFLQPALIEAESDGDGPAISLLNCYNGAKTQAIPKYGNGLWRVPLVAAILGDGACWNGVTVYYVADDTGLVTVPTPTPGPSPTPRPSPTPTLTPGPSLTPSPSPTPTISADDTQATLFNTLMACLNSNSVKLGGSSGTFEEQIELRAKWREPVILWPLQAQGYNYAGIHWSIDGPGFAYDISGNLELVTGQWTVGLGRRGPVTPSDPASQLLHEQLC